MSICSANFLSAFSLLSMTAVALEARAIEAPVALSEIMPRSGDFTSMWWTDGFPGTVPSAAWKRRVQTGSYMMEQDVGTLQFSHLGPAQPGGDYGKMSGSDPPAPQTAELTLQLKANGKTYHCNKGGVWTNFTGPRLIESGRFMQRADITDLTFVATDGGPPLNVEARFETAAWPDRLGMIFSARPGTLGMIAGEASFGKIGGGFGLDGTNEFIVPHDPALDPEQFTLALWVYVPAGSRNHGNKTAWLVCKNRNEHADGNFGIVIHDGVPKAHMNIGGGRDHLHTAAPEQRLATSAWSHLAITYDGDWLRLHVNGKESGAKKIGKARSPGRAALAFGRREDNSGDGYHFHGVIDEVRFYDRALPTRELHQQFLHPEIPTRESAREWNFDADGLAAATAPPNQWKDASMEIRLRPAKERLPLKMRWQLPEGHTWSSAEWNQVWLSFDPVTFERSEESPSLTVHASEMRNGTTLPVEYDPAIGWHRVNLDASEPIPPEGSMNPSNDAIERIAFTLANPTDREQTARLMFEKTAGGIRQQIGSAVTGISATLRDMDGIPTGIPVQISKNWHNKPEGGVHAGTWFHGISQVRVPAGRTVELEFTLSYGHWGGVAAASHTQLCLIGWGSNQLWQQSALGAWGESICYEPDQCQASCTITDVRAMMVNSGDNAKSWSWTGNVGGGDFFRFFNSAGQRVPHSAMRTTWQSHGPCLSEVTNFGNLGDGIKHSVTASLSRTDDVVRGIYRIRMDASQTMDLSRFAIFQVGADTYNFTREAKMAIGDETGLAREWQTRFGGNIYRTEPYECTARIPWVSLHEGEPGDQNRLAGWANRGIVIRSWKARLGGKDASPWLAERGVTRGSSETSTMDIIPPPGVSRLQPGNFVDAIIEYIVMPQHAKDYYGPNAALRTALAKDGNTWRMIHREAVGNDYAVAMKTGTLERLHPDVRVQTENDAAELELTGGIGYIPVTFTGLTSPRDSALTVDGAPLDQAVHGNDYWQTDYQPTSRTWSRTYNIPARDRTQHIKLSSVR